MNKSTILPAVLTAGDSWQAVAPADVATFSDSGVDLVLRVEGGFSLRVTGERTGTLIRFTAAPAQTAPVPPGAATWALIETSVLGDWRHTLATGRVQIAPDPVNMLDARAPAERILAAIEATIAGRVTKDADSYSIEGRSIARTPIPDLLRLRQLYKSEVAALRNPNASPVKYRRIKL